MSRQLSHFDVFTELLTWKILFPKKLALTKQLCFDMNKGCGEGAGQPVTLMKHRPIGGEINLFIFLLVCLPTCSTKKTSSCSGTFHSRQL